MSYTVLEKDQIKKALQDMTGEGKKVTLLSGDWGGPYAVAVIAIEGVQPSAEVHEKSADVWCVLSGNATFILGGSLINAQEIREGEHTGDEIQGGTQMLVSDGDYIDIPPGIPHQIDARGERVELLIVKINKF